MTTSTFSTAVNNASTTTFDAWVNSVYTLLVTNLGITQTADTGQMAVPSVAALPGAANTSAGYYVFRFNDTLQATSPIFFRLDFGTGNSVSTPAMWITVGTGSSGAGVINGTALAKSACMYQTVGSATNFPWYGCYNATQGVLWIQVGQGGQANGAYMGLCIFRSVDNTGAPTADSAMVLVNNYNNLAGTSAQEMVAIDYNNNVVVASANPMLTNTEWLYIPFGCTSSVQGTQGQVFPCFQLKRSTTAPGLGITNVLAMAINTEIAVGTTIAINILGSTTLTYINIGAGLTGYPFINSFSATTYGIMAIWQ